MQSSNTYDHIIIGGGSAGCLIAARLTEDETRRVLLVEAGGADFNKPSMVDANVWSTNLGTDADWKYRTIPQVHANRRIFDVNAGKVLGGSSTINGTVWVWGQPSDFDSWAQAGNANWDFDNLRPIFQRLETSTPSTRSAARGDSGPLKLTSVAEEEPITSAFYEACRGAGLDVLPDINGPVKMGAGPREYNIKAGSRFSVAAAILKPALDRPNLDVLPSAKVESLIFRGTRCVGIRCQHGGEYRDFYSEHDVVLSAGTIGSPALLMRSGIGSAEQLRKLDIEVIANLPGVGENLHDHCMVSAFSSELRDGYAHGGRLGAHLFTRRNDHISDVDIEVFLSALTGGLQLPIGRGFSLFGSHMRPESRGTVKLTSSKADAPLLIDPNYLSDPADVDALCEAVKVSTELAMSAALLPWRGLQIQIAPSNRSELADFVRNNVENYFHPVGTCMMGSGEGAVVDSLLCVHGVENLRVADSSVMPRITTGNTLAPTLVIAERAASLIVADK